MAAKSSKSGGNWVTINGVHVLIENGKITKGPAKFIGSTLNDLPSSGKSTADRKAELKAKYANKTGGSTEKPKSTKEERMASYREKAVADKAKAEKDIEQLTGSKQPRKLQGAYDRKADAERRIKSLDNATKSESTKSAKAKATEERLRNLEGKHASQKNIQSALNRDMGNSIMGGQTVLKNSYGEEVLITKGRMGVEAEIRHKNGNSSLVYAPTFEKQVKGRGGKMKTVSEVDYEGLANMINDNSFHSNSPNRIKRGKYDYGKSTSDYMKARDNGTYSTHVITKGNTAKSASTETKSTGKFATQSARDILIERKTTLFKKGGYSDSMAKELATEVVDVSIKMTKGKGLTPSTFSNKNLSAKNTAALVHQMERFDSFDPYAQGTGKPLTKTPSQNSYSTSDKVSKTAGKVSRAGTSVKTASATPSAQANFSSAVQSAQKGTGSKNEKYLQKRFGKAFDMGKW